MSEARVFNRAMRLDLTGASHAASVRSETVFKSKATTRQVTFLFTLQRRGLQGHTNSEAPITGNSPDTKTVQYSGTVFDIVGR